MRKALRSLFAQFGAAVRPCDGGAPSDPVAFWGQAEARIVFGTILVAALLMVVITGLVGFTRLLGLGHFVWYPMLYYLWTRLPAHPVDQPFGLYLRILMVLNGISLVLDVADVLRSLHGERAELVEFR